MLRAEARFSDHRTSPFSIRNANSCYFDLRMKFPGNGTVRLAYTYPTNPLLMFPPAVEGATVYSRSVALKLG